MTAVDVRVRVAADLPSDQEPIGDELLAQVVNAMRQVREHDHSRQREDWFCLNLISWAGNTVPSLAKRVLDAERQRDEALATVAQLRAAVTAGGAT